MNTGMAFNSVSSIVVHSFTPFFTAVLRVHQSAPGNPLYHRTGEASRLSLGIVGYTLIFLLCVRWTALVRTLDGIPVRRWERAEVMPLGKLLTHLVTSPTMPHDKRVPWKE
ncbi:hypothetical protein QBC43DRAFT_22175 [Cladorrhinum sp. PSN259]|nr:hypothetical protein QBC43DRAFT_22175 [Cladorrhinum sp. PSN259]